MSLSVNQIIASNKYRHLLTLPNNNMVPFIFDYIKKRTPIITITLSVLLLSVIPMVLTRISLAGVMPWHEVFKYSIAGFLIIPLLLALPHELLHIIPYFFSGARDIRIGANWRDAYFYVTAHNHPVGRRWFLVIALTPAVVVTAVIICLLFMAPPPWQWSLACSLFTHLTMCAGDLALVNYYYINRDKRIVTWDDTEMGEAYFYEYTG